jgi:hypothetical protein
MAELLLPKQVVRVRFPSLAPFLSIDNLSVLVAHETCLALVESTQVEAGCRARPDQDVAFSGRVVWARDGPTILDFDRPGDCGTWRPRGLSMSPIGRICQLGSCGEGRPSESHDGPRHRVEDNSTEQFPQTSTLWIRLTVASEMLVFTHKRGRQVCGWADHDGGGVGERVKLERRYRRNSRATRRNRRGCRSILRGGC